MWQLVYALCHRLILNNNLKGCVMVMADPSDLGHGKNNNNTKGWLMVMANPSDLGHGKNNPNSNDRKNISPLG